MEENLVNCLTDEKVFVKYLIDTSNGITEKKHTLHGGMSNNASIGIPAPILTKRISVIFSKEELAFLGNELNEDLSPNSDFWTEYRKDKYTKALKGDFPIYLKKEGAILSKLNPLDYIKIRILEDSPIIANSMEDAKQRKGCRFVLINEKDVYKKEKAGISIKQKAVKLFGKYEDEASVLTYVLRLEGKSVPKNPEIEFLQNESWKVMEKNPELFANTLSDAHLKTKIKLGDFLQYKLINKSSSLYYDLEGNKLALDGEINDLQGCVRYLDSGIGGEYRLGLEAKVKLIKK